MATLLESRLGHPLIIEETNDIGKERPLGIDPLGVCLEVKTADP